MDFLFSRVLPWELGRILQTFVLLSMGHEPKRVTPVIIVEHYFKSLQISLYKIFHFINIKLVAAPIKITQFQFQYTSLRWTVRHLIRYH